VISGKTLRSRGTLNRLEEAIQRSVVISSGWDIMDFLNQLQRLAAGNVTFATIPVIAEDGWSDDGAQSVVTVDPTQVREWVAGLLHDQDTGEIAELPYSREQTTVDVVNASDVSGLAGAVSDRLTIAGFTGGTVGNNDAATKVTESQVLAVKEDDPGAQAVAQELGGLPVRVDPSIPPGTVRVILAEGYAGPGSGLDGTLPSATVDKAAAEQDAAGQAPLPSPVITAGSNDPKCVN
jgi:hypothetical protein